VWQCLPVRWGEIEYAKAGEHYIAYREVVGDDGGDQEIVMVNAANFPMDSLPQDPVAHRLLEGLAGLGRLVVFDRRGVALSDPVTDWETPLREQWAEDLAAVITASGCDRPVVFSWHNAAVARACSVQYPGLIGRLVLFNASTPLTEADAEWIAEWVESTTRLMNGEPLRDGEQLIPRRAADPEFKAWSDAAGRAGASPSQAKRLFDRLRSDPPFDSSLVATPTLVITRSPVDFIVPAEYFRRGADQIPSARHVELGDGDASVFGDGVDDVLVAISEYLTGEARLPPAERHLAAILFTDLVDSTRRAASEGDAGWKRLLDRHDAVNRTEVARRGGEVIKTTGDGVLALFPSVTSAVKAAARIRDRLGEEHLAVRVGIHVGEIDRRGDDVSGLAVNVAARVMSAAGTGQILTTLAVALIGGCGTANSIGERTLKGVDGTWELFAVETQDTAPA
jgi:class 3 adenylate cyclase/pimeloyl-ACP methyl ester carboxylesterase